MNEKKSLEDRLYTAEEVEEIIEREVNDHSIRTRRKKLDFGAKNEKLRAMHIMIELDVSVDLINQILNEPDKDAFCSLEYIQERKYLHWRQYDSRFN